MIQEGSDLDVIVYYTQKPQRERKVPTTAPSGQLQPPPASDPQTPKFSRAESKFILAGQVAQS